MPEEKKAKLKIVEKRLSKPFVGNQRGNTRNQRRAGGRPMAKVVYCLAWLFFRSWLWLLRLSFIPAARSISSAINLVKLGEASASAAQQSHGGQG